MTYSQVSDQRTRRRLRRMDAGQHGLESEAALQSLPATLIADRRSAFPVPSPVRKTPLRMPAQARKPSNYSLSRRFFAKSPGTGSIADSSTLNGRFQVRQAARSLRRRSICDLANFARCRLIGIGGRRKGVLDDEAPLGAPQMLEWTPLRPDLRAVSRSSGCLKPLHLLDVQCQTHQIPLAPHLVQAAQAESAETEHLLDPPVGRLR